jgi:hypothetical protein
MSPKRSIRRHFVVALGNVTGDALTFLTIFFDHQNLKAVQVIWLHIRKVTLTLLKDRVYGTIVIEINEFIHAVGLEENVVTQQENRTNFVE